MRVVHLCVSMGKVGSDLVALDGGRGNLNSKIAWHRGIFFLHWLVIGGISHLISLELGLLCEMIIRC